MKILHRLFSMFLMAGMLFGFLQPASALAAVPQSDPAISAGDKIETQLLEQFTAEGTADFIVRFTQQADLSPAYGMSWEERGWFVYNTLTETAHQPANASSCWIRADFATRPSSPNDPTSGKPG
jgi:hypothetical protein